MRILLALALIFVMRANASEMTCENLFSVEPEIAKAEVQTEDILRQIVLTPLGAKEEIKIWADGLREPLTLMEFTSVSYLLRSKYVHDIATPEVENEVREKLKRSYANFTGREPVNGEELGRLPNLSLVHQSRDAIQFHFASFEPEKLMGGLRYTSPLKNYVPEKPEVVALAGLLLAIDSFHATGGDLLGGTMLSLAVTTVVSSTIEHVIHRYLGHPITKFRRFLATRGPWAQTLRDTTYGHLDIHHLNTFTNSQTDQFASPEQEAELMAMLNELPEAQRQQLLDTDLGLTLNLSGQASIVVVTAPILTGLAFILHTDVTETIGLFSPLAAQVLIPTFIHPVVHKKFWKIMNSNNRVYKLLASTRIVEAISRSHWMHHKGGGRNYNLVPGGDWILGQYRRPNLRQFFKMRDQDTIGASWDRKPTSP